MNFKQMKAKFASLFRKKTFLLVGLLIILFISSAIFLIIKNSGNVSSSDKTWEIHLSYNSIANKFSLENLAIANRETIPDTRSGLYSPYKLQVLGRNGNVIFQEKIFISEKILYDILLNALNSTTPLPSDIKSVIFVPYQADAAKILILKNNETVLQINVPKLSFTGIVESAQAAAQSVSCGPVTTVFINDNYSNAAHFKSDVAYLENMYNTTPPYNVSPSIFDFQEVDSPQNFGCATSGISSCIANLSGAIKGSGLRYFPNAQKFIVLVDNPNALKVDKGLAGVVNGIGGDVIIYTNYPFMGVKAFSAAAHELEGHAIGYLWDRYVSSDPNYPKMAPGDVMSNCSTNSQGEPFWFNAGSTGGFPGCTRPEQYAPFPLTCQSNSPDLISGGTNNSIMSAIGCSPNQFDQVEQSFIKTQILPNYKACPIGAVVQTDTSSTTIGLDPVSRTINVGDTITLNVFLDPGTNQIDFTKLVINYDPTKLAISAAGPAVCPARPTDALCPNPLGFPLVLQGPVYTSGTISVTFSVGGSPASVIQKKTQIATITFKALAPTDPGTTQIITNLAQSQALSIASTDTFTQNVLKLVTPALITIIGPSPTPSPTPVPTVAASSSPIPSATPATTPTYSCNFDPATCNSGQTSIQLCVLKCTPN